MNATDILSLIGINENEIDTFELVSSDTRRESTLFVYLKPFESSCPSCKSKNYIIKEKVSSRIKHSILSNHHLSVIVFKRRYYCKDCNKTFTQPFGLFTKRSRISLLTKHNIVEDLYKTISITRIAKDNDVSWSTVVRILDDSIPYQKGGDFPGAICIDEFCFKHGSKDNKYPCVISNPFDKTIIDIIESRRSDYLKNYFSNIPITKLSKVKYFITDMWEPYRVIKRRYFQNAIHIVDYFHVIKAFNEIITSMRTQILKSIVEEKDKDCKEYRFLKKNWKIFLMNRVRLSKIVKVSKITGTKYYLIDKVDQCLKNYPKLNEAYQNREDFIRDYRKIDYYRDAERLIDFSIKRFEMSFIPEVKELGKMFQNWRYEIINSAVKTSYGLRITNSISESNNNMIQTLINVCYGLVSFQRLRKRVLMISREKLKKT